MAAAGGIGLSVARMFRPGAAHAVGLPAYDPGGKFDLAVSEVELRRNSAGRVLMAERTRTVPDCSRSARRSMEPERPPR
jgi:hypothetical protein